MPMHGGHSLRFMPPSRIIQVGPIRLGIALFQLPALARQHIAENSDSWRSAKHRAQWLSSLATYAFPTLGSLRVNEITRRHVIEALSPIWTTKPETARRVWQRIRDLQPGGGRHQRRACQAAPCQGPPPCPALQGPARSSPDGPGVHRQPVGEAGLPDAGPDGMPLRGGSGYDLG